MAGPWEDYQSEPVQEAEGPWSTYSGPKGDDYYRADGAGENSEWDQFWYSFNKVKTLTESAGDIMEARTPLGRVQITDPNTGELDIQYIPPSDELKAAAKAGDEELAAEVLSAERDRRLQQRFGYLYGPEGQVPEGNLAGTFVGALVDPTTAVPIANGFKAAVGGGAALGAIDGYLYSKGEKGEADPMHTLAGAALGATTLGLFNRIGRAVAAGRGKLTQSVSNRYLDDYERRYTKALAEGVPKDIADVEAKELSGIYRNGVLIDDLYKATGRTAPDLPDGAAARAAMEDIQDEAGRNWLENGILRVGKAVEPFVGTTSTRLRNVSSRMFHEVRKVDLQSHVDVHNYFARTEKWARQVAKLQSYDKGAYNAMAKALYSGDIRGALKTMHQLSKENPKVYGELINDYKEVRNVLDELYKGYKSAGYKLKKEKFFFPRIVKNPEGLGIVRQSVIKQTLANATKRKGRELTRAETGQVISGLIRKSTRNDAVAKVSKSVRARKFDFMTDEMMPHYAEVNDSLHAYIRQAVNDINRRKFLDGQGIKVKSKKGVDPRGRDLEWGLGELAAREAERLNLSPEKSDQLLNALRARFGKGEQASSIGFQHFKNLSYGTTLGNIFSAITQLGDNAFGMYLNGVRNHLRAIFGKKLIQKTDIGLSDIAEDLVNDISKTKKFVDFTLRWSGFSRLDKFGKENLLNGAFRKYKKQLSTENGRREFVAKWGRYFENDTGVLMSKIKKGQLDDDNVRLLLWHTLADVQPIGLSEMPEKYLLHPNGRVFYMLKTFTIKQFDLMRREIIQDFRNGDKLKAAKNAARFAILFGLINGGADTLKDALAGKEIDLEDTAVDNMVKLVGISRYQTSKMAKDGPAQVLLQTLLPPVPFIDKPAQAALQGEPWKAFEAVPLVGRLTATHMKE